MTAKISQLMPLGPVCLEGLHIRLDPLTLDHLGALRAAAEHDEISTYLPLNLREPEAMERRIEDFLARQRDGIEFPFAVVERSTGRVIGSTSYLDVSEANKSVEIGWTWYVPEVWGKL